MAEDEVEEGLLAAVEALVDDDSRVLGAFLSGQRWQGIGHVCQHIEQIALFRVDGKLAKIRACDRLSGTSKHETHLVQAMAQWCCFGSSPFLEPDCSNFAAWYRSVWQERPEDIMEAFGTLKNVLDGFRGMSIRVDDERIGWLRATFEYPPGNDAPPLLFDELSDGQRTLIVLYTVLFTQLKPGRTVIFDEPDNYVAFDEIQPFLMEALDRTERAGGPQLFVISHHPELINQLAEDDGYTFFRERGGPMRIARFECSEPLAPAELITRGALRGEIGT